MNLKKTATWVFISLLGIHSFGNISWDGCSDLQASDFVKETLISRAQDNTLWEPLRVQIDGVGRAFIVQKTNGSGGNIGKLFVLDSSQQYTKKWVGDISIYRATGFHGLVGMVLSPDFDSSGHIYTLSTHSVSGKIRYRLSRYTIALNSLSLNSSSQKTILEYDSDITEGHIGGDLEFDEQGALYISTGNDTWAGPSQIASNIRPSYKHGPSANTYKTPIDERISQWNALRTSANTNDLRGKVLRIKPIVFSDNASPQPGIGQTYTIPNGNMYPSSIAKTRPEIYAMGLRNPFSISVSHQGVVYIGDVGPQGSTSNFSGPSGGDQLYVIEKPENLGHPMFVHGNQPYTNYNFVTETAEGEFNPKGPINESKFNTGLRNLFPPKAATAANYHEKSLNGTAGKGWFPGGSMSIMVGPVYRYDPGLSSQVKFPPHLHNKLLVADYQGGYFRLAELSPSGKDVLTMDPIFTNLSFSGPVDWQFGKDGSLYVVEYGLTWRGATNQTKVSRITYKGSCAPSDSSLFPDLIQSSHTFKRAKGVAFHQRHIVGIQGFVEVPNNVEHVRIYSTAGDILWSTPILGGATRIQIPKQLQQKLLFVRFE